MRPRACFSMLQDLPWKLVNMFTPIWMWAAAVHMCVQHTNFEGERGDSLPWPCVENAINGSGMHVQHEC